MIPSQRTYGLLGWGVILTALIAVILPSELRLVLACLGGGLYNLTLLVLATWDSRQVAPVRVTRTPLQRFSVGRDNSITLRVEAGRQAAILQIRDAYPPQFAVSTPEFRVEIPAYGTSNLTYTLHPTQRGEYLWGDIQVRQLGHWGLGWRDWRISQNQTVAVYPDLIGLRELSIRLTLQSTGVMRQARRMGTGTEFAELREYSVGDDPRLIDWKATARRSSPLVRVLEPEQEQTLIILLDRGRLMTAKVQGLLRFDWGLKAALSLALAGLHRGDRVGIGVFDRRIHTWIPPERGLRRLSYLIERLTPIQPVLLEPDYFGAATTLVNQQTRRALVVVITDLVDSTASAELLAAMGRLSPRYLPFCVTLRDPTVDAIAQTIDTDLEKAYSRAVALDLLAQRQIAFATLKQKGVLVLDAPANQISHELVERYLQLKARSLL